MFRTLALAAGVGAAANVDGGMWNASSAEPTTTGGTLKLSWSDCGSGHGHVHTIEPSALTLGQKTTVVGKGSVDVEVTGGQYEVALYKGSDKPLVDHKGDLCKPAEIGFPGVGKMSWAGFKCPLMAGPAELDLDIYLNGLIPAGLATGTLKLTGHSVHGYNLLCVLVKITQSDSDVIEDIKEEAASDAEVLV